jgi:hypothetical protein
VLPPAPATVSRSFPLRARQQTLLPYQRSFLVSVPFLAYEKVGLIFQ